MSRDADLTALHKLPKSVFREVVDRLSRGQKIKAVVRWLMMRPRGELQHEGHDIMRKHVIALRDWMQEDKHDGADNSDIPGISLPTTRIPSARQLLGVAFVDAYESLQQPEARPADRAKARRDICHVAQLLGKCQHDEPNAWLKEYPYLGMDGKPIDPEQGPKQLDPKMLALIQEAQAMDPADRMLGLSIFGLADEILRLKDEEAEEEQTQEQEPTLSEGEPESSGSRRRPVLPGDETKETDEE